MKEYTCTECNNQFQRLDRDVRGNLQRGGNLFCSRTCFNKYQIQKITTNCGNCHQQIQVKPKVIRNSKSGFAFCSRSCAATYNNIHKTTGTRRSKLEEWLEKQLTIIYPNLEIKFNSKDEINSELDIYIPSLKLAFELNGIFHYEPIFGDDKLDQIQNNDKRKFQACLERGIELCIIDTSQQKTFTVKDSKKYLSIIIQVLSRKGESNP